MPMGGTIANTPHEEVVRSTEVNYYGSVHFVKHMAAAMENGGSIILFSSMTSTHPLEYVYSYACAKAAADCLVRYADRKSVRVGKECVSTCRSRWEADH